MPELELDPARSALVVIDLQNGIVARDCAPYSSIEVQKQAARLLEASRIAGVLSVLVHVGGAPDHVDRLRRSADQPTPWQPLPDGWSDFVDTFRPRAGEVEIFKRQWGAFYGTDLDLQLRRRGIDTLILCGIASELGVESTARDAYERNYRQILVEDAMSGLNGASHRDAIENIFPRLGHVRDTGQVLALLRR